MLTFFQNSHMNVRPGSKRMLIFRFVILEKTHVNPLDYKEINPVNF